MHPVAFPPENESDPANQIRLTSVSTLQAGNVFLLVRKTFTRSHFSANDNLAPKHGPRAEVEP